MDSGMMKKVFVSSPYSGDVAGNADRARGFLKFAVEKGCSPIAPHLLYPQVLDNDDPASYELGMRLGFAWLAVCDEMWLFGSTISSGMEKEIVFAVSHGIPIRRFSDDYTEIF